MVAKEDAMSEERAGEGLRDALDTPEPKPQPGAEQRIRELKAELTDLNRENGRLMYERNVEADQERAAAQHYMQIAEDAGVRIEELEAEVERLKEQIRTEVRRQKGAVEQ